MAVPALVLALSATGLAPGVQATHWCDGLGLVLVPTSGAEGSRLNVSVLIGNNNDEAVSLAVRARFDWETQYFNVGNVVVPAHGSRLVSGPKQLSMDVGDHQALILVQGINATGAPPGFDGGSCPAVARTFAVTPMLPLSVVGVARWEASGVVNLTALVSGGRSPYQVNWTLDDGSWMLGSSVVRALAVNEDLAIQVTVVDGRGVAAADRMEFAAPSAAGPAASRLAGGWTTVDAALVGLQALQLVLLLAVILALRRRMSPLVSSNREASLAPARPPAESSVPQVAPADVSAGPTPIQREPDPPVQPEPTEVTGAVEVPGPAGDGESGPATLGSDPTGPTGKTTEVADSPHPPSGEEQKARDASQRPKAGEQ
ncbi:MAG: hypothetical protein HYT80_04410 [Euryarchaeota archaeon]|nr:hypothetical protein [Euryarchaeota archaeon]